MRAARVLAAVALAAAICAPVALFAQTGSLTVTGGASTKWQAPVADVDAVTCSALELLQIRLDTGDAALYYCDGSTWVALGGVGGASILDDLTDVSTAGADAGEALVFGGATWAPSTAAAILEGDARLTDARTPTAHAPSHEDGGTDELDLTGLSGLTATPQTPATHGHAATEVSVADAGGFYAGADAEAVLQELGPSILAGERVRILDGDGRGDYTTLAAALADLATEPRSATELWHLIVMPGDYSEPTGLVVPPWVVVSCFGGSPALPDSPWGDNVGCQFQASDGDNDCFVGLGDSALVGVQLTQLGSWSTSGALVCWDNGGYVGLTNVSLHSTVANTTGVRMDSTTSDRMALFGVGIHLEGFTNTVGVDFSSANGGRIVASELRTAGNGGTVAIRNSGAGDLHVLATWVEPGAFGWTTHYSNTGAGDLVVDGDAGSTIGTVTSWIAAHAARHSLAGADPVTVTNLAGGCTDAQVLGGTAAGTGVECQADATGTDDQIATEVPFTPAGGVAATDVQAAIEEVDAEHTVDTDTTCLDAGVACLFAASTTEGGAASSVAVDAIGLAELAACPGPDEIVEYGASGVPSCIATPSGGGGAATSIDYDADATSEVATGGTTISFDPDDDGTADFLFELNSAKSRLTFLTAGVAATSTAPWIERRDGNNNLDIGSGSSGSYANVTVRMGTVLANMISGQGWWSLTGGGADAGLDFGSGHWIRWSSGTTGTTANDAGLARQAPGIIKVTDGALATGSVLLLVEYHEPTDSPPTCDDATRGAMYFDDSLGEHCGCKGATGAASWQQLDGGGGC